MRLFNKRIHEELLHLIAVNHDYCQTRSSYLEKMVRDLGEKVARLEAKMEERQH